MFVGGAREAESVGQGRGRTAGRARSRKPPTRAATCWALTLPRPLTLAGLSWPTHVGQPGLTETDWTPDFTTIQDFAQLLGEDGLRLINEAVVKQAVALGLADPKVVVADMTAQEAAIPQPNELCLG